MSWWWCLRKLRTIFLSLSIYICVCVYIFLSLNYLSIYLPVYEKIQGIGLSCAWRWGAGPDLAPAAAGAPAAAAATWQTGRDPSQQGLNRPLVNFVTNFLPSKKNFIFFLCTSVGMFTCYLILQDQFMVTLLDGSLEQVAHMWTKTGNLTFLRHLLKTAVLKFFYVYVSSYHLKQVSWINQCPKTCENTWRWRRRI